MYVRYERGREQRRRKVSFFSSVSETRIFLFIFEVGVIEKRKQQRKNFLSERTNTYNERTNDVYRRWNLIFSIFASYHVEKKKSKKHIIIREGRYE